MMKKIDCRLTYIVMGILIGLILTTCCYYTQFYATIEDLIFKKTEFEVEKLEFHESAEYQAVHKCAGNDSADFFAKCVAWELNKK